MYNNNNSNNVQEKITYSAAITSDKKDQDWKPIIPAPEQLTQKRLNEIIHKVVNDHRDESHNSKSKWKFVQMFRYTGAQDSRLYYRLRFNRVDENGNPIRDETGKIIKTFRPVTHGSFGNGKPNWYMKNPPYLPLYNLDQILEHPEKRIVFAEGEKTADSGSKRWGEEYIFTTAGGSTSAKGADLKSLQNRDITILRDNDSSGHQWAETLAKLLTEAGARSVHIVPLPEDKLPVGWDIADKFPEGFTPDDLKKFIDLNFLKFVDKNLLNELQDKNHSSESFKESGDKSDRRGMYATSIIDTQGHIVLTKVGDKSGKNGDKMASVAQIRCGARHNSLVEVAGFLNFHGIHPKAVQAAMKVENSVRFAQPLSEDELERTVEDVCHRYTPQRDIWHEAQTGWPHLIDLPDMSPEIEEMTIDYLPKPLQAWIADACDRFQIPVESFAPLVIGALAGVIGCKLAIRPKEFDDWIVVVVLWVMIINPSGFMKSDVMNEATKFLRIIEAEERNIYDAAIKVYEQILKTNKDAVLETTQRRVLVNDTTTQKLGMLLKENPSGILSIQDEFFSLLVSFSKQGREEDRTFYLKAHNGYLSHNVDRVGRESIFIPHLCVSILGSTQEETFLKCFAEILKTGRSDDGFVPRIQMLFFPRKKEVWKDVKRHPDYKAQEQVETIFKALFRANFSDEIYKQDIKEIKYKDVPSTCFNDEAQVIFDKWLEKNMNQSRSGKNENCLMRAYLEKNRSFVCTLALIFRLVDYFDPSNKDMNKSLKVREDDLLLALRWRAYSEQHARKGFGEGAPAFLVTTHRFVKEVKEGKIYDRMPVRDLYRHKHAGLKTREDADLVLECLKEHNHIHTEKITSEGGRKSEVIRIHPALIKNKVENIVQPALELPEVNAEPIQQNLQLSEPSKTNPPISDELEGMGFV